MYIYDVNIEFEKLESTESVDNAQAATATLHNDWLDIKSADVTTPKGLSDLFSSGRAQKAKQENEKWLQINKTREAFENYYKQGEPRKGDHRPT